MANSSSPSSARRSLVERFTRPRRTQQLTVALFEGACCGVDAATRKNVIEKRFRSVIDATASVAGANVLMVSGRLNQRSSELLRAAYDEMPAPRWVVALGTCAASGGTFAAAPEVKSIGEAVPVDFFVPGSPVTSAAVIGAIAALEEKLRSVGS